jgi:hypothetical protein
MREFSINLYTHNFGYRNPTEDFTRKIKSLVAIPGPRHKTTLNTAERTNWITLVQDEADFCEYHNEPCDSSVRHGTS